MMKHARMVSEYETNACTVRIYFDTEPQNYYLVCVSGQRNESRLFGPFKQAYLENLVECLKDVKEMKGKHYYMDSPPLVEILDQNAWSVSPTMVDIIKDIVPANGTILELGSGEGTGVLAEHFTMFSVEHDRDWTGKFKSTYIYAPLIAHKAVSGFDDTEPVWYDPSYLRGELPEQYDLILVDGPPKHRSGFIKYFDLFRSDVPIIFDDVQRTHDHTVMVKIAARLSKPYTVYACHESKHFGIITP
jgi:hypothetical protein